MIDEDHASDTNLPSANREEASQTQRKNPRELDEARYAALLCRAHSDQTHALVDAATSSVAAHELSKGTRTNQRKGTQAALRSAVERLLADLLLAQMTPTTKGYVYREMRPEGFTGSDVGYRVFKRLVDAMVGLKLLEVHKGFQNWRPSFDGQTLAMIRKATRFRATMKLLGLFERHGIRAADFHQHFLIPLPEHPLQLRMATRRNQFGDKIKGKPMRFEATAFTEKMERQLKELNAFFDQHELRGGIHRGYLRIFNNGDHPDFKWNMGGRLYSHGDVNYQQMDGDDRLRMTINGDVVYEIDIRASYLTIFHALYNERFDPENDPYDIPELGPEARDVVKMWVTASFGNNAPIKKWPREVVAKYRERTGQNLGKRYAASKVGAAVMNRFPLLSRLGEVVGGQERGWAQLMYIESQAMFETMLELMREQIPSLAVHDSIIVPFHGCQKAKKLLTKHYKHFAKAIGLTQKSVHRIERGEVDPKVRSIAKIEQFWAHQGICFEHLRGGGFRLVVESRVLARG